MVIDPGVRRERNYAVMVMVALPVQIPWNGTSYTRVNGLQLNRLVFAKGVSPADSARLKSVTVVPPHVRRALYGVPHSGADSHWELVAFHTRGNVSGRQAQPVLFVTVANR